MEETGFPSTLDLPPLKSIMVTLHEVRLFQQRGFLTRIAQYISSTVVDSMKKIPACERCVYVTVVGYPVVVCYDVRSCNV